MTAIATLLLAAGTAGLASTAHCAAMCGPLAAAACSQRGREGLRAGVSYGLGRVVSYMVTGALTGTAGGVLLRTLRGDSVKKAVALAIGASLVVTALRVLRVQGEQALVPLRRAKDAVRPPAMLAGVLTGFLPCGALASALVLAAGAASGWGGALVMVTFALASMPGIVAALAAGRMLSSLFARMAALRYLVASMLVLTALWIAARPWTMPERTCHCHTTSTRGTTPPGG
jgi:hypothetical protein